MKVRPTLLFIAATVILACITSNTLNAQQYKLRQSTHMASMKTESTIYVKGMRKRTEGGGYIGTGANQVTIEQCDLQRTIKINDKKKLYYIEPFSKETEEIIEEDTRPAKSKPVATVSKEKSASQTGGVITMWYNITDTGERKKVYGLTARHVWTTQKIKPSPDACMMKDSMIIKTDGWYIDLPEFNCPVNRFAGTAGSGAQQQLQCKDRFITRRSGRGKLGFPLTETRTMIMGNGNAQTTQFETSLETLEFSTAKLDSMLFEIPVGYKLALSEEELQDKFDVSEMMKQAGGGNRQNDEEVKNVNEEKKAGMIRIGVYEPRVDQQLNVSVLQKHLVNTLTTGSMEAVAIASEDDARKLNCDFLLSTNFIRIKQGSKVGGFLKAVKNSDPFAASSYNIEAGLTLVNLSDGSIRLQQKLDGKYEGSPDEAAKKALDRGCSLVAEGLQ